MKNQTRLICILALLHFSIVGCKQTDVAKDITAEKNKTNIQKLANSMVLYAAFKQNQGPESAQQLTDFIQNDPNIERNLDWMGIDREKFANYLTSSVDQQEFKVRWGVAFNPDGAAIPLVFEQNGNEDGVRRVSLSDGRVLDVESDAEYKNLLAGKISKADAGAAAWEGSSEAEPEKSDAQSQ